MLEEGLTLGDKWFNEAYADAAQKVYDKFIVPLVEKNKKAGYIVVSRADNEEIYDMISKCNFSTLQRICKENCINLSFFRKSEGWFANTTNCFTLSPITYRYMNYYYRKAQCFSPRDNRNGENILSFLKE